MPSPTEVSLKAKSTGALTYYSTYADARSAAGSGDTIQIWADLDEQIILKDGVDIFIAPGRVINMSSAMPTIIDNGVSCICTISGNGIIKNSYHPGLLSARYECIKITNGSSRISIVCDYILGFGKEEESIGGQTINIVEASKFNLICNSIQSNFNTAIDISDCNEVYIKCKKIQSGSVSSLNIGVPVILTSLGIGFIYADELNCKGFGSCLVHKEGILKSKILKITTQDDETSAEPTILLDDGSENQELILYFDEIKNLNSNDGDAVKVVEGKAVLKGRRIYSYKGFSLDLASDFQATCNEVISDTKGVFIHNPNTSDIVIDSDYIEGSTGYYGTIYSIGIAKYTIKNAKVKNSSTSSSSIGMYIDTNSGYPNVTLNNVIVVTGNLDEGQSIYGTEGGISPNLVNNYGLFLNVRASNIQYVVGTIANYKVTVDSVIT